MDLHERAAVSATEPPKHSAVLAKLQQPRNHYSTMDIYERAAVSATEPPKHSAVLASSAVPGSFAPNPTRNLLKQKSTQKKLDTTRYPSASSFADVFMSPRY